MNLQKIGDGVLWLLLLAGFVFALKISYQNFNGAVCPHIGFIPICYVVTFAYGLMIASLVISHNACKHYFFSAGWGTAFIIALLGSLAEVFAGGGVCPTSGGGIRDSVDAAIPLCYVSLAMLVVILILFLIGPYQRACDLHNSAVN